MRLVILSVLIIGSFGAPAEQTLLVNEDGTYQFSYETGNEGGNHFRTERKGPDGAVIGKYSYKDPTGELRVVNYRADDAGFVSSEDGEVPQPSASEIPDKSQELKAENFEKEKDGDQEEKESPPTTTEVPDDDEEKPLKLEEPIDDGPPEGFPIGFFTEQFSALRRLPEIVKEEKPTKKKDDGKSDKALSDVLTKVGQGPLHAFSAGWQPEGFPPGFFLQNFIGLRRLEEPVKEEESAQNIDNRETDKPDPEIPTAEKESPGEGSHKRYVLPFPSFIPHLWPASSHHHPVYVYAHQQPNAYSYGYYY